MRTGKCAFAVMFLVMIAGVASVSAAEVRPYARLSGVIGYADNLGLQRLRYS